MPRRAAGFTLIELMITVAIVGVLAATAMTNFMRFQLRSKVTEAKTNLASIRTAEHSYVSSFSTFVPAAPSPVADPALGSTRFDWSDNGGFGQLGWAPEGTVYFNYRVTAAPGGCPGAGNPCTSFTAEAASDLDVDGALNFWGYVQPDTGGSAPAGVACPATGVYDPNTGLADAFSVVGPCGDQMGRTIF
jgi:type IV pilus assembly protein PilA